MMAALTGCIEWPGAGNGEIPDLLAGEIARAPGKVSVMVTRVDDGTVQFDCDAARQVPSASTIKVLIMAEVMRQVEAGKLSLDDIVPVPDDAKLADSQIGLLDAGEYTLRDLVTLMIIVSDNTATNVLIDLVGFEPVNRLAAELGLKATALQRKMLDFAAAKAGRQNYTSAADMSRLFVLLGRRQLVSPEASDIMVGILKNQKDTQSFKRFLPEELVVAHKSGWLDNLEHEVGIFYLPDGDYVLAVFTNDCTSNAAARDFIGHLTRAWYEAMGGELPR